jgi:hypothetical protein
VTTAQMRGLAATILDPETGPAEFRGTASELAAQVLALPVNVITVAVRNVSGNELVYPADSRGSLFAALLGVKSFNAQQISALRALGFTIHVAAGQLPEHMRRKDL